MSPRRDIGTGPGEGDAAFGQSRDPSGLTVWGRDNSAQPMGVSRSPAGLDLYALNPEVSTDGWAVYTFRYDSTFTVTPGANILADVLLVGGGGSGGGGSYGGGGGAGGFIDKHDILIYSRYSGAPRDGGYPDGEVIVGAGGAEVPITQGHGNQGANSRFGEELIAYGGGYGGRNVDLSYWPYPGYSASDGGSGGGARGTEILRVDGGEGGISWWNGIPGEATHNAEIPEGGDARDYEQGHDGGPGENSSAWYNHSTGGGGGAQWPAYGLGYLIHGGLGRVCDIAGWYQHPNPIWNEIYEEAGWRYCPWFAGGGAGRERPNNWGYPSGEAGYGGGGSIGNHGVAWTGGGGGGWGWFGPLDSPEPWGEHHGKAPGPAGGCGIVIVRIPLVYKQYVTYPVMAGDGTWPDGVLYKELPLDQPHLDELGEEPVTIWAFPHGEHNHSWGWSGDDIIIP